MHATSDRSMKNNSNSILHTHIAHEVRLVDAIAFLEVLQRVQSAHPHGVRFGQLGREQVRLAGGDIDSAKEVWLFHAERPVKVRLLTKEGLAEECSSMKFYSTWINYYC